MERGVEARKLRHAGKALLCSSNHTESNRHVQRRKRSRGFELLQYRRSDPLMLSQRWSAVHYTVPDSCNSRRREVAKFVRDHTNSVRLFRDRMVVVCQLLSRSGAHPQLALAGTNSLHSTAIRQTDFAAFCEEQTEL